MHTLITYHRIPLCTINTYLLVINLSMYTTTCHDLYCCQHFPGTKVTYVVSDHGISSLYIIGPPWFVGEQIIVC